MRTASESAHNRRLGEILLELGFVSPSQLARGLSYQQQTGAQLGEALIRLGELDDHQLAEALATQKHLPLVPLSELLPDPRAVALLSETFIRGRLALPLAFDDGALVLAMANPLDVITVDDVGVITGHEVTPVVATRSAIADMIDYLFSDRGTLTTAEPGGEVVPLRPEADERRRAEETSVIALVDEVLDSALRRRASDIHFEPHRQGLTVRARVDGVMQGLSEVPMALMGGVLSRLKIMGDMDIAEKRLPQDGRATYRAADQTAELRIASIPTVYGENIAIRLLDETMYDISLTELGMGDRDLDAFRQALHRPHGQILITGPTGSGKSTTLYSALEEINLPSVKIYTVEDPVERKIPGIQQLQVRSQIGLSFSRALRSLVRSDPDVIMIGEIRDLDTATIATEAALTGHLVLSTLHTNDAPSTVTRLVEMGIPPYLIASALHCVVAQRLTRRLCPHCRADVPLGPDDMTDAERAYFGAREVVVAEPVGCRRCYGTGYSGRVGLFEVMPIGRELRDLIGVGMTADDLRDVALGLGMTPLVNDGLSKVEQRLTSIAEVRRVAL